MKPTDFWTLRLHRPVRKITDEWITGADLTGTMNNPPKRQIDWTARIGIRQESTQSLQRLRVIALQIGKVHEGPSQLQALSPRVSARGKRPHAGGVSAGLLALTEPR